MENKLEKAEALQMKSLLKDVGELKDALEMQCIKEQIVVSILQIQDKDKLEKIVIAVRNVLSPLDKEKKEIVEAEQGNT